MSGNYQKALGRKVAQNRKRRGLSQREFAGLVGRSEAWVSQVERGVRKVDRMVVLEKLAEVLEIPVSELAAEAPIVAATAEERPAVVVCVWCSAAPTRSTPYCVRRVRSMSTPFVIGLSRRGS
ncbi:helix-turn-helix domain-containing protein [Nocardiopsis sp. CNR-923]|uniref:helix-turn-helix domain-containing protein n=1 Tax=Nocardiopsis sp. CNR-923 TaxID=1904965 RepID=UPI000A50408A|nr:helix-turn-helix transcriptional regulator [Nocardiopsis sp. CNR-923]